MLPSCGCNQLRLDRRYRPEVEAVDVAGVQQLLAEGSVVGDACCRPACRRWTPIILSCGHWTTVANGNMYSLPAAGDSADVQ